MEEMNEIEIIRPDDTMSPSIAKLADALSQAQGELTGAIKDSSNPFFKSKYADLAAVQDAIRGPFSKHGLAYIQTNQPTIQGYVSVQTLLAHKSGEWIRGTLTLPMAKPDAQGAGSAITYARRYALAAIAGIAQVDDDANAASGKTATPPQKPVEADPDALASLSEADTLDTLAEHWKALTPKQRASVGKERLDAFKAKLK